MEEQAVHCLSVVRQIMRIRRMPTSSFGSVAVGTGTKAMASRNTPEADLKAGFFELLEELAVGSAASWADTRDQLEHVWRYLAVEEEQRYAETGDPLFCRATC